VSVSDRPSLQDEEVLVGQERRLAHNFEVRTARVLQEVLARHAPRDGRTVGRLALLEVDVHDAAALAQRPRQPREVAGWIREVVTGVDDEHHVAEESYAGITVTDRTRTAFDVRKRPVRAAEAD
jgi:hypothetical protein